MPHVETPEELDLRHRLGYMTTQKYDHVFSDELRVEIRSFSGRLYAFNDSANFEIHSKLAYAMELITKLQDPPQQVAPDACASVASPSREKRSASRAERRRVRRPISTLEEIAAARTL